MSNATVLLGRSVVAGNSTGIVNAATANTIYAFKNNLIFGNGTDGAMSVFGGKADVADL